MECHQQQHQMGSGKALEMMYLKLVGCFIGLKTKG